MTLFLTFLAVVIFYTAYCYRQYRRLRQKPPSYHSVRWGLLVALLFPTLAQALTIVSVHTTDEFLSREVLTPDCAWLDTFERTTTTTIREDVPIFVQGDSGRISTGPHPGVWYPGYANPCFVKEAPHPAFWDEDPSLCDPRPYDQGTGRDGIGGTTGGTFIFTTTQTSLFTVRTDFCKDCEGGTTGGGGTGGGTTGGGGSGGGTTGGHVVVPESGTGALFLLGIATICIGHIGKTLWR